VGGGLCICSCKGHNCRVAFFFSCSINDGSGSMFLCNDEVIAVKEYNHLVLLVILNQTRSGRSHYH